MPPKKTAVDSADPESTSTDALPKDTAEKKSDAAAPRRPTAHPSTAVMVREALQALDSRKGVSSQAIQSYIKQKYPSVDLVRLKHLVRNSLKKGIENGTLVRPANSSITTGALGKFRLAPKVKELKPKSENTDPNVQPAPKAEKGGEKKPKKAGTTKKKTPEDGETKSSKNLKPPKKPKKDEASAPSKVPPAKKPKAKKADPKGAEEESSDTTKTKPAKPIKKVQTAKAPKSKSANADNDAPVAKAAGKRGKKPAE